MPGSTPTSVPSVTPTAAKSRFSMLNAVAKPPARSPSTSIGQPRLGQHDVEDARRQAHAEELGEAEVDGRRQEQPDDRVAQQVRAAEGARRRREEEGRRNDVAEPGDAKVAESHAV